MVRGFKTHEIRKTRELTGCLWDFHTMPREGEGVSLKAAVPSCWETYPDTLTYRGSACYERKLQTAGTIRLICKGVSHTATVYLDGQEIVRHYNAYTPFSAIVKDVPKGEHLLQVVADNSFGPESALHVPNDYQSYGGISRPVLLEELSGAYLSSLHFTPVPGEDGWYAALTVKVENLTGEDFKGRLQLEIVKAIGGQDPEEDSRQVSRQPEESNTESEKRLIRTEAEITLKGEEVKELSLPALPCPGVEEWAPAHPVLYFLKARLLGEDGVPVDDLIDRVGFREIRVSGRDLLLNGRKLRIKGFCRHEDHPQFGCSLPLAAMEQDLLLMKDMGANSVRTSHYPNDELFLDLCDERGILVWEENHARGLSEEQMKNSNFQKQCEDCIREMIETHYNHPAIYIWGILNECASHTAYGRSCYEKQLAQIRSLDQSRPRSFASCQFKTDICFDLPEVVSYNIYPKWYHDTPVADYLKDLYDWVQEETGGAGKPFLITETGAGAIYGYRTPLKVKWSEEYQAETLKEQLTAVLSKEGCSGIYIWQFCDCRVCDDWFGGRPRTMNNKGVVDEYRRPKLSYEVVKEIFRSLGDYC